MKFGTLSYAFIGSSQALSAVWFYIVKDQNSYFMLLAILMLIAIIWVVAFVPESPRYLLEKQKYEALNHSLRCIAKMNGIQSY
jgi:membrane protein YdbS with pleckstrin-like domain